MAEDLTQSSSKRELAWGEYKQALGAALLANAVELPPEPLPDDSWIMSRL
jgi:hypothetical protein